MESTVWLMRARRFPIPCSGRARAPFMTPVKPSPFAVQTRCFSALLNSSLSLLALGSLSARTTCHMSVPCLRRGLMFKLTRRLAPESAKRTVTQSIDLCKT